jgi:hypothetical protein
LGAAEDRVTTPVRWTAWAAGALWVAAVGAAGLGVVLRFGARGAEAVSVSTGPLVFLASAFTVAAYATVSVILAVHRPQNRVGWLFGAMALSQGLGTLGWSAVIRPLTSDPPNIELARQVAWLQPFFTPAWHALFMTLLVWFPDGRPMSRRWGWVVPIALMNAVAMAVGLAFTPGGILTHPHLQNPFGAPGQAGVVAGAVRTVAYVVAIGVAVTAVGAMVARYRQSEATTRKQLKWFALGSAVAIVGGIVYVVALLATGGGMLEPGSWLGELVTTEVFLAAALLPIAATIGILRHGLYDIDRILSQSFVFGALTAILAGVYAGATQLFQELFVAVTGETSNFALALATLVIAASFTPVKRALQSFVERRWGTFEPDAPSASTTPAPRDGSVDDLRRVVRDELAAALAQAPRERWGPGQKRRRSPRAPRRSPRGSSDESAT